jgi:GT2 family glycosyltransferase
MALISMAVYATDENNKTEIADRTIQALLETVDISKHRIVIVNNASCNSAAAMLCLWEDAVNDRKRFRVIHNDENLGTAGAVNLAWKLRQPGECVVKMDDDMIIHQRGWADQMEDCIARDPGIGIIGLKRIDLAENPHYPDPNNPDRAWAERYRTTLRMLPPYWGVPWRIVEDAHPETGHVMGSVQMYNPALLDKIGFLYQPRLYGFDDSLAAVRCRVAGFKNCFLPHVEVDHIDLGNTPYQKWKETESGKDMGAYNQIKHEYETGKRSIYYNPYQ